MITLQNDTPNYNLEDHLANTKMLTFSNQMFCKQKKNKKKQNKSNYSATQRT